MAKASDLAARMRETALKEKPKPALEAVPATDSEPELPPALEAVAPATGEGSIAKTMRRKQIATSRYTIDLEQNQRKALKLFALNQDCDASEVVRTLLAMLQESKEIQAEVRSRIGAARSAAVSQ